MIGTPSAPVSFRQLVSKSDSLTTHLLEKVGQMSPFFTIFKVQFMTQSILLVGVVAWAGRYNTFSRRANKSPSKSRQPSEPTFRKSCSQCCIMQSISPYSKCLLLAAQTPTRQLRPAHAVPVQLITTAGCIGLYSINDKGIAQFMSVCIQHWLRPIYTRQYKWPDRVI